MEFYNNIYSKGLLWKLNGLVYVLGVDTYVLPSEVQWERERKSFIQAWNKSISLCLTDPTNLSHVPALEPIAIADAIHCLG